MKKVRLLMTKKEGKEEERGRNEGRSKAGCTNGKEGKRKVKREETGGKNKVKGERGK